LIRPHGTGGDADSISGKDECWHNDATAPKEMLVSNRGAARAKFILFLHLGTIEPSIYLNFKPELFEFFSDFFIEFLKHSYFESTYSEYFSGTYD